MPLTIVPIGLEVLNIGHVWLYEMSFDLATKIILTVAIIAKFACYFSGVLVIRCDNPKLRNVLLASCALINGGIIAFSIITGLWMLLINNAVFLALLVMWSYVAISDITITFLKGREEK